MDIDIVTIKTFLDSVKTIKDLLSKSKRSTVDYSDLEEKLIQVIDKATELESRFEVSLREAIAVKESGLNEPQVKLKKLLNEHGVEDNLIAKFIKENVDENFHIVLSKINNISYIFDKLSDEHIEAIFCLFGTNQAWMYNQGDLYPYRNYYKNIRAFIDFVLEKGKKEDLKGFVITNTKLDKAQEGIHQPLYFVFRAPIAKLFDKTIYRYYPINNNWHWDYQRTRYQAKSVFLLSDRYSRYLNLDGITIPNREVFDSLSSMNNCPHLLIDSRFNKHWYPYDYVTSGHHENAKEPDELDAILEYVEEEGYDAYFREKTNTTTYHHDPIDEALPEGVEPGIPLKPGESIYTILDDFAREVEEDNCSETEVVDGEK